YDAAINAVVLTDLAEAFQVDLERTGRLTGPIIAVGLGAFGALPISAIGDRIGRRPLLIATTFIYALFTGLTASAQTLGQFIVFQFLARTFLIAEYATAITIMTEEFPAAHRGRAMGTLTALGAFGVPTVAIFNYVLNDTALGWRSLYLIGLLPLMLVGVLRLKLKETHRWLEAKAAGVNVKRIAFSGLMKIADRAVLFRVCALYFLTHFGLLAASYWWPYYAQHQRKFSEEAFTILLVGAYPLGVTGYFVAGRLQDRYGRRLTGSSFLCGGIFFSALVFQMSSPVAMFPALALAVFFGLGANPVLNAVVAELFHTEIRATAVALARSIFGTLGSIAGPIAVGILADAGMERKFPGWPVLGDLGDSVTLATLVLLPAAALFLRLPETAGRELETI
ncbi:MAG: MFS transporter, partial [Actinomycetota bacterium]